MLHAGTLPQKELTSTPNAGHTPGPASPPVSSETTVFHVTHWKAGSQWIHKILLDCWPDRVVRPEVDMSQFLGRPLGAGNIYPTVYVTREEFQSVQLPPRWARFVMVPTEKGAPDKYT